MVHFVANSLLVSVVEEVEPLKVVWALGEDGSFLEDLNLVLETVLLGKALDIREQLAPGDALQRVLDPCRQVLRDGALLMRRHHEGQKGGEVW